MRKMFLVFFAVLFAMQSGVFAARSTVAKQDAFNSGTKINESGVNSLIDSECTDSYFGCMDAFCIVDNVSGGRCQCSNKHADLSKQFDDLSRQEENADYIAEYGADFLKTSDVESDIKNISDNAKKKKTESVAKKSVSAWGSIYDEEDDEDFDEEFVDLDDISNKHGDELYIAADEMCFEQTPSKCKTNSDMLKMLYTQKIKSDCLAFENTIKQGAASVKEKMANAQKVVLDAALSQLQDANKYGLGQCEKEFKKCMQTTAGCGSDFAGCVLLSANENVSSDAVKLSIGDDFSNVQISASTMDNLLSKKILCESVLNNCEKVKNDVWGVFLQDVAPIVKTAELNAEDDLRSNCIKTVSDCYAKSCREHFDVNDKDGSYDMCLSRPENYKSFCKIELEPCLSATGGSYENPSQSRLWNGILSKLASLRVTACSNEFKSCIQDDDRCGPDYSKCIGLDAEDIALICPDDKLTACYHEYEGKKETVRETLANIAGGIMVEVRSALADACENAVKDAMIKTCGDSTNCNDFIIADKVGSRTLEFKFCEIEDGKDMYANCKNNINEITDKELGKTIRNGDLSKTKNDRHIYSGLVIGQIMWDQIVPLSDYSGVMSGEEYINQTKDMMYMDDKTKEKVKTEVGAISNAIKGAISALESDPRVQFCMTGRQVSGLSGKDGFQQFIGKSDNATFPNITQSARVAIVNGALRSAQANYNKKHDEIIQELVNGTSQLEARYAAINDANFHLDVQDSARKKCMLLGEKAAFSNQASGHGAKHEVVRDSGNDENLVGYSSESTYKFKRQVTTTFNMDNMICTKCTRTQECKTVKRDYCKKWDEEQETCEDIQY